MSNGGWTENAPAVPGQAIPTLGNIGGLNTQLSRALDQIALWQRQQDLNIQRAGVSPARIGTPAPSNIPAGVPQGGQAAAPMPTQTPGTGGITPRMATAQAPQVQPAYQVPYATTGRGAIGANAIYGVSNMLAQQRQQDQQKEYTQAEGLWTQLLNAQANMQQAAAEGREDPYDKRVIDTILSDKKNVKMIQDALGTLTVSPDQQQQQDPTKQAQASGARAALQKFGRGVAGAFDPRTQAQRIPGGTQMPAPNQPGGVMWNYPQPTEQQREEAAIKAQIEAEKMKQIMQPGAAAAIAKQQLGGMTPYQQAQIKLREEAQKTNDEWRKSVQKNNEERTQSYKELNKSIEERNRAQAKKYGSEAVGAGGIQTVDSGEPGKGPLPADPRISSLVKALDEYRIAPNALAGYVRSSGLNKTDLMSLVTQYDPLFNEQNYAIRYDVSKSFTAGKDGANITSLNMGIHHLNSLYNAYQNLDNGDWKIINWAKQTGKDWTKGNPQLKAFDDAANAVTGELATTFKGTSGTDVEIRSWREKMSKAQTPAEMAQSMAELYELIGGRIEAMQAKWDRGMGGVGRNFQMLDPASRSILGRHGQDALVDMDSSLMGPRALAQPAPSKSESAGGGATEAPPPPPMEGWTPLMQDMGQDDPSPMTPGGPR